jgi:hypothetical protein
MGTVFRDAPFTGSLIMEQPKKVTPLGCGKPLEGESPPLMRARALSKNASSGSLVAVGGRIAGKVDTDKAKNSERLPVGADTSDEAKKKVPRLNLKAMEERRANLSKARTPAEYLRLERRACCKDRP